MSIKNIWSWNILNKIFFTGFGLIFLWLLIPSITEAQNNLLDLIPKNPEDPTLPNKEIDESISTVLDSTEQIGGLQGIYYWLFSSNAGAPIGFLEIVYSIIGSIAITMIIIEGAKIIFSQGDEEAINNAKSQIGTIIWGLILLAFAIPIVELFMDPNKAGIYNSSNLAYIAQRIVFPIITFFQIVIGAFLLYALIRLAIGYILSQGSDDGVENQMNSLKNLGFGFLMTLFATPLVNIFFPVIEAGKDGNVLPEGREADFVGELVGIIKIVFVFVGVGAFGMLIVASFYLVSNFGSEDMVSKAKRIIIGSVSGILMAIFAYVIVGFLLPTA